MTMTMTTVIMCAERLVLGGVEFIVVMDESRNRVCSKKRTHTHILFSFLIPVGRYRPSLSFLSSMCVRMAD